MREIPFVGSVYMRMVAVNQARESGTRFLPSIPQAACSLDNVVPLKRLAAHQE